MDGGQLVQRDAANLRLDVVAEKALRGLERGWSEFYFRVVLHPHLKPTSHGVGLGPPIVDAHVFLNGFLQLFLDLGLRLAQHVLDDPFSSLRVIACGVPALPSAILSFSDVPFPVCSSFWHGISPFRQRTIP